MLSPHCGLSDWIKCPPDCTQLVSHSSIQYNPISDWIIPFCGDKQIGEKIRMEIKLNFSFNSHTLFELIDFLSESRGNNLLKLLVGSTFNRTDRMIEILIDISSNLSWRLDQQCHTLFNYSISVRYKIIYWYWCYPSSFSSFSPPCQHTHPDADGTAYYSFRKLLFNMIAAALRWIY